MRIGKTASAGTLESSDVLVTVEPGTGNTVEIEIEGATAARFGAQIRSVVAETLEKFGVSCGRVRLQDKGALDCTITARLSAALLRAAEPADSAKSGDPAGSAIPWETLL
jgi:citrate lyase subunit gamma (acyl carrier protein)